MLVLCTAECTPMLRMFKICGTARAGEPDDLDILEAGRVEPASINRTTAPATVTAATVAAEGSVDLATLAALVEIALDAVLERRLVLGEPLC